MHPYKFLTFEFENGSTHTNVKVKNTKSAELKFTLIRFAIRRITRAVVASF